MRRQRGLILPALLLVLLVGGLALSFGQRESTQRDEARRQRITMQSLARARAALLAYAQTYHLSHENGTAGQLPCPDTTPEVDGDEGTADTPCGATGLFAIGRLPFRTLGLPPQRDGWGECLWYAVAGTFKNRFAAGPVTWDTRGQFSLTAPDGRVLNPATDPRQHAVAVVFSPGPPQAGQRRGAPGPQCNGDADADRAVAAFLDRGYAPASNVPYRLEAGSPGDPVNNDQAAWISAQDVFDTAFVRSTTFTAFVDGMADALQGALDTHPSTPAPADQVLVGNVAIGGLPPGAVGDDAVPQDRVLQGHRPWADHFRYAICIDGSDCLGTADGAACRAVLLFGGRAAPGQDRMRDDIDIDAQYFEGDNLSALADPTRSFAGATGYDPVHPETDLVRCIP